MRFCTAFGILDAGIYLQRALILQSMYGRAAIFLEAIGVMGGAVWRIRIKDMN